MSTEQVSIDALIPYARNSRTHSDEQVAQIAASIREFGFTNPVLIGKDNDIIAGHGRVMAARKLGLDVVPCIRLDHLTETQKRAYVIADNKLALNAGWDMDMLQVEIDALIAEGFDTELLGFDDNFGSWETEEAALPLLKDGDRSPIQQMTFTLHDEQADVVKSALELAIKKTGGFDTDLNTNKNGNALYFICSEFLNG